MKAVKTALLSGILLVALVSSARASGLGEMGCNNPTDDGVTIKFKNGLMKISMYEDGIIRVRATSKDSFAPDKSFALAPDAPKPRAIKMMEEEDGVLFETGLLKGKVSRESGALTIWDKSGALIMEEPKSGGIFFEKGKPGVVRALPLDEHYYGFGEKTGPLDKRGYKMTMWNTDNTYTTKTDPMYQSHPYYLAVRKGKAYGVFQDNTYKSVFDVGNADHDQLKYTADGGELNYYFMYGPTPKEVLTRYGMLVGRYPLPPLWSLGYMQSRWSYKNEHELRDIAGKFRQNNVPCDVLVLDIHYMDHYKVFTFNKGRFPNPSGLFGDLEKQGFKIITIVDPGVKIEKGYFAYEQGKANDYFVRDKNGKYFKANVWPGRCNFPDFTRPEVRDWWGGLHKYLLDAGVDGIWDDMNEISAWANDIRFGDFMVPIPGTVNYLNMVYGPKDNPQTAAQMHNVYANFEEQATYEGLRKLRPDDRPFIFTRSAFPGVQRYASMWTGDDTASWPQLKMAAAMNLNVGISGVVMCGSDIGGFVGAPTPELYARWLEEGVFYPFSRSHTMEYTPSQDPFSYGAEVQKISKAAIDLRYRLLPYTYSLFKVASETGLPIMRAMVLEFPGEEKIYTDSSQFMWGDYLLVAPVVEEGAHTRDIYLPAGKWYRFESSANLDGGRSISENVTLASLPLFVREGAIMPLAPVMQYTSEKPWSPLTIEFYAGSKKSCFTQYEDDGKSFNYAKGDYLQTQYCQEPIDNGYKVTKAAGQGNFHPTDREVFLKMFGQKKPASVMINQGTGFDKVVYSYDAQTQVLEVRLKDSAKGFEIKITY